MTQNKPLWDLVKEWEEEIIYVIGLHPDQQEIIRGHCDQLSKALKEQEEGKVVVDRGDLQTILWASKIDRETNINYFREKYPFQAPEGKAPSPDEAGVQEKGK